VIIEPNRRRRNRVFRVLAGIVAVAFVGGLLASGWRPPAIAVGSATASPPPSPTATAAPVAIVPTPVPTPSPTPAPSPTQMPNGCWPPPADLAPATLFYHAPRTGPKVIALTFDDGTNSVNVRRIIGVLSKNKVNATFFPTGQSVHLFPDLWKSIADMGYPIANHTYSHQSLKGLCFQLQLAELLHDEQVLRDLGVTMLPVMRPPYEEFDNTTRLATTAAGESHVVLWDIDTNDWRGLTTRAIIAAALRGKAGSIILMHTSPVNTAHALPAIIGRFRKRGYTFVTIGQLLGIGGPVPFPPPSPSPGPSASPVPTP